MISIKFKESDVIAVVNKWQRGLREENSLEISIIITPDTITDEELVYHNGQLVHVENIDYTPEEYLQHLSLLWNKREYLAAETKHYEINTCEDNIIYNARLTVKIKDKRDNTLIVYDNMDLIFKLNLLDDQLYLTSITNIIQLENNNLN
ncbi:MAG: hypothetical protein ACQEQI_08435 [Bacillota bacterium]